MNAGGHGAEMADNLTTVTTYDLGGAGMRTRPAGQLALGYRTSNIAASEIVLSAELQLEHGNRETSEAMISEIVRWRRANQPGGQNAGSVFANPEGDSAGRLIDASGLKGLRIGSAEVSTKHANFIQADPGGSADDVFALIREVQRRVRENHGIVLRPENVLVGFDVDAPRHERLHPESLHPESVDPESTES
jgi:UDP-N-acetylmuramate dehydrogenase